jgi:hypothetical protein
MEHPIIITSSGRVTSEEGLQGFLAKYIATSMGKAMLANSMAQPLRTRLDYQAIARKVYLVQQLPVGNIDIGEDV